MIVIGLEEEKKEESSMSKSKLEIYPLLLV